MSASNAGGPAESGQTSSGSSVRASQSAEVRCRVETRERTAMGEEESGDLGRGRQFIESCTPLRFSYRMGGSHSWRGRCREKAALEIG